MNQFGRLCIRYEKYIAMTAHAMASDKESCLEAGMDGYLSKPLKAQDLFAAIENAVATPVEIPATRSA